MEEKEGLAWVYLLREHGGCPRGGAGGRQMREHYRDGGKVVHRRDGGSGTRSVRKGQKYGVRGDCDLNDVVL